VSEPQTIGKYEILDLLGTGGMGKVYRARDPVLERIVALKVMHLDDTSDPDLADAWRRFLSEARAIARLNHPTIVTVYQFFDAGPTETCFAMEFVDGDTIDRYVRRDESLRLQTTLDLMCQLLTGLAYAHAQGIVHRDVKPSNLLVTHDGQLKITDFGIAKVASFKQTQTGLLMGTPSYMAPERFTGGGSDQRCDIYAAGVLCFELLAGRRPFAGSINEIVYQICHVAAPLLSECAPGAPTLLDPIIATALQKSPSARYQSAEEFHAALSAVLRALGFPPGRGYATALNAGGAARTTAQLSRTSQSGADSSALGWSAQEITDIIARLSPIMGPLARVVVKRQAALTRDRATLYESIARQLRTDDERARFLNSVSATPAAERTPAVEAEAAHDTIPPATLERTTRILTRYLGPIAVLVVKKTARDAVDEADLYAKLATRIADDAERARFVSETGRDS
jgi:serine/threonine protein kinase